MANQHLQALFAESLNELKLTDKQKAVLNASLTLFAQKGFDSTSTSDIANLAGVSEGTVYKQFKTKEGILIAILGPFVQKVIPKAATEFTNDIMHTSFPNFGDFLYAIVKNRMTFAFDNMPQLKIILHEATTNQEIVTGFGNLFKTLIAGPLGNNFKHYQENSQLVNWPLPRIVRYITVTVLGYVIPATLTKQPINIEQASHEATEFLLKGLQPDK